MGVLGRGRARAHRHSLIIEAPLAPAEDSALDTALVALAVFLEALRLLALAALLHSFRLNAETKALGLGEVLALFVDEAVDVSGEGVDDCLVVFFLVGGVVAAGVAVAALRTEELLLEALAVELEAARSLAVAAHLLVSHRRLLRLLLIY